MKTNPQDSDIPTIRDLWTALADADRQIADAAPLALRVTGRAAAALILAAAICTVTLIMLAADGVSEAHALRAGGVALILFGYAWADMLIDWIGRRLIARLGQRERAVTGETTRLEVK